MTATRKGETEENEKSPGRRQPSGLLPGDCAASEGGKERVERKQKRMKRNRKRERERPFRPLRMRHPVPRCAAPLPLHFKFKVNAQTTKY